MNNEIQFTLTIDVVSNKEDIAKRVLEGIREDWIKEEDLDAKKVIAFLEREYYFLMANEADKFKFNERFYVEIELTLGLLNDMEEIIKEVRKELNS